MAKRVQLIRHNTAGADAFTGLSGEITVDTTARELRLHDSLTAGGIAVARKDLANVASATAAVAGKMTAAQVVELTNVTANLAQEIIDRIADVDAEEARALAAEAVEVAARIAADLLLIPLTQRSAANGVATLNASSQVVETALLAINLVGLTTSIADLNKVLTTDGVQTATNKTFTSPAINTPLINGLAGYGMVILDTPEELVASSAIVGSWTTFNAAANTLKTAGATKAILRVIGRSAPSSATVTSSIMYLRKTGSGLAANNLTLVGQDVQHVNTATAIVSRCAGEAIVNLDGNNEFDWYHTAGTAPQASVVLVGYFK